MANYEIQYVTIGNDKHVPAEKVVCSICKKLDMNTTFITHKPFIKAMCSKGHKWEIDTRADA